MTVVCDVRRCICPARWRGRFMKGGEPSDKVLCGEHAVAVFQACMAGTFQRIKDDE